MYCRFVLSTLALCTLALAGCYHLQGSDGGGQTSFEGPREVEPGDIALPTGYKIEAVAEGLTFPTGIAFDEDGIPHVVEAGYSYGEVFTTPRLLRLEEGEDPAVVFEGENPPWNGIAHHDGDFFVAGGHVDGGKILRISSGGDITVLIDELPSKGDHHSNGPVIGPDGQLYFGQGVATNSAVVGLDNYEFGWLARAPEFHDVPCQDVVLTGRNFNTTNPLDSDEEVETGAFTSFGTPTEAGQEVPGQIPCTGAVFRFSPDGGELELVAWGFRNPFGLAFAPGGDLYVTDNAYDDRGSRPAWGAPDLLWRVEEGRWYGWPDFAGGVPLAEMQPPGKDAPEFILMEHPDEVPSPVARFGVHSSSNGFDFSLSDAFGFEGEAFVAQFGDLAPQVAKVMAPVGFQVVRVNVDDGIVQRFAANHGDRVAPASKIGGGGLERPVAAKFNPDGTALYVVDFGVLTVGEEDMQPRPETGVIWRITKEGEDL